MQQRILTGKIYLPASCNGIAASLEDSLLAMTFNKYGIATPATPRNDKEIGLEIAASLEDSLLAMTILGSERCCFLLYIKSHTLDAFSTGMETRRQTIDRHGDPMQIHVYSAQRMWRPAFPLTSGDTPVVFVAAACYRFFRTQIAFESHNENKRGLEMLSKTRA